MGGGKSVTPPRDTVGMNRIDFSDLARDFARYDDRFSVDNLRAEAAGLIRTVGAHGFELVEPWPYPPGPSGPVRLLTGARAHGVYARSVGEEIEVLVANNGWPIEHRRLPGPVPPTFPLLGQVNYWVSQQGNLSADGWFLTTRSELGCTMERVGARAKPLGLADTTDPAYVEAWCTQGRLRGLATVVEEERIDTGDGEERFWFLGAARREPFEQLVDIDALLVHYAAALPVAGAGALVDRVTRNLEDARGLSPADFLDATTDLVVAPFADGTDAGCSTEVTGLVLGYWPPASIALMTSMCDGSFTDAYPATPLPNWQDLRLTTADYVLEPSD